MSKVYEYLDGLLQEEGDTGACEALLAAFASEPLVWLPLKVSKASILEMQPQLA
jgi:hypothetical protein